MRNIWVEVTGFEVPAFFFSISLALDEESEINNILLGSENIHASLELAMVC